jgi:hypothetical protein
VSTTRISLVLSRSILFYFFHCFCAVNVTLVCFTKTVVWPATKKPNAIWDMVCLYDESKTDLKLPCECYIKFLLFKGAHVFIFDISVLHTTAPKPLQSAPELQKARLWALL